MRDCWVGAVGLREEIPFVFLHVSELIVDHCKSDFAVFVKIGFGRVHGVEDVEIVGVVGILQWNSKD